MARKKKQEDPENLLSYFGSFSITLTDESRLPRLGHILKMDPSPMTVEGCVITVTAGKFQITPSGGLVGSVGEGNEEKSFGLPSGAFIRITDLAGKLLWGSKPEEPKPETSKEMQTLECVKVYLLGGPDGLKEVGRCSDGMLVDGRPGTKRHDKFEAALAAVRRGENVAIGEKTKPAAK